MTKNKSSRPPIITIMGHIDHGKTTLLDALRQTSIAQKESGGITQHIGAYQLEHKKRKLTFIDTPGHAAFAAMRSRGVKITDLVILVIDAVESVKPQTKECLDHINNAKAPFLIALNKMDLPNASPDIVKKDLADAGVLVEGYGGDIVCVEISAKTKKGLDQLLEMIILLADMQQLKANIKKPFEAVVIESSLDQRKGPLATIIVKSNILKIGDNIQAGPIAGKVKALFDHNNQSIKKVIPSQPAQILGFKKVPQVGSLITNESSFVEITPKTPDLSKKDLDKLDKTDNPKLKIILKTDVAGTLEAIMQNLGDEVILISQGIGSITESDILLAQSTVAKIIAFRVKPTSAAAKLADIENIFIQKYSLIHDLLEDIQQQILKLLEPTIDEEILGEAKIVAQFTVKGITIAGCQVTSGKLTKGNMVHLMRNKDQIANSKIKSIHQEKEIIDKAKKGQECGIAFTTELDFKLKDKIIAYKKIN